VRFLLALALGVLFLLAVLFLFVLAFGLTLFFLVFLFGVLAFAFVLGLLFLTAFALALGVAVLFLLLRFGLAFALGLLRRVAFGFEEVLFLLALLVVLLFFAILLVSYNSLYFCYPHNYVSAAPRPPLRESQPVFLIVFWARKLRFFGLLYV
jgi:hypothetical protein